MAAASAPRYSRRSWRGRARCRRASSSGGSRRSASRFAPPGTPRRRSSGGAVSRAPETGLGARERAQRAGVEQDPGREAPAELAQARRGASASYSSGLAACVEQAEVDVHAVAGLARVEQRHEASRACLRAARSRAPPPSSRQRGRPPARPSAARRDLELVRGVLGEEALGLDVGLDERGHQLARERFGRAQGLERERQRRAARPSPTSAGTRARSWPGRASRCSSAPATSVAGTRAGSSPTGARPARRCRRATAPARSRPAPRSTRTRVCGSGSRRRSPVDPNGLGSASGPSGVRAWLAGTQPTPVASGSSRSEARTARPRTIAPRSQRPARRARPRSRRPSGDRAVVPEAFLQAQRGGRAHAAPGASAAATAAITPPAGLSGRAIAAARRSSGCRCTP